MTSHGVRGAGSQTPSPTPTPMTLTPSPTVMPTVEPTVMPTVEPTTLPVPTPAPVSTPTAQTVKAALKDYKGVMIGTATNEVRKILGSPQDKGDDQDFYVFSDNESAQFFYDNDHKVKAIAITYMGNLSSALTPMQVFGIDVPPNAEGGIFNMVRYPEAGYWISYNRTSGDNPIISIAIQKM